MANKEAKTILMPSHKRSDDADISVLVDTPSPVTSTQEALIAAKHKAELFIAEIERDITELEKAVG